MVKFVPMDRIDEDYEWFGRGAYISSIVTMGHVMTTAPIILLLESVEFRNGKRRSIVEVLGRRWLIVCSSLIFFSFSNSTTDGTTSRIAANYTETRCGAAIHEENPIGVISSGALDNTGQKSQATFQFSAFVYYVSFLFTSFLDQPSHFLAFHHRQCAEDNS